MIVEIILMVLCIVMGCFMTVLGWTNKKRGLFYLGVTLLIVSPFIIIKVHTPFLTFIPIVALLITELCRKRFRSLQQDKHTIDINE